MYLYTDYFRRWISIVRTSFVYRKKNKGRILKFDDSRVILRSSRKFGLEPPPRSTTVGEDRGSSVGEAVD